MRTAISVPTAAVAIATQLLPFHPQSAIQLDYEACSIRAMRIFLPGTGMRSSCIFTRGYHGSPFPLQMQIDDARTGASLARAATHSQRTNTSASPASQFGDVHALRSWGPSTCDRVIRPVETPRNPGQSSVVFMGCMEFTPERALKLLVDEPSGTATHESGQQTVVSASGLANDLLPVKGDTEVFIGI